MEQNLQSLMVQVAQLGELSEAEARRIMGEVYNDGIVSRPEAEALFSLSDRLTQWEPDWAVRFIGAICDFLLQNEPPMGLVNEEEARWLLSQIAPHGKDVSIQHIDLVLKLLQKAELAPAFLGTFVLSALASHAKVAGRVDQETTERIRRALFAPAGEGGIWVSRREAEILFEINDAIAFAKNDASWNDLFARAVANHLLARAHPDPLSEAEMFRREAWLRDNSPNVQSFLQRATTSFASGSWFENVTYSAKKASAARSAAEAAAQREAEKVTADENDWLFKRLGWDEKTSPAERALIEFLNLEVPGLATGLAVAS
ncbi:MAG: hypothetical protein AAF613_10040 [Pseudomonadota bacterium]